MSYPENKKSKQELTRYAIFLNNIDNINQWGKWGSYHFEKVGICQGASVMWLYAALCNNLIEFSNRLAILCQQEWVLDNIRFNNISSVLTYIYQIYWKENGEKILRNWPITPQHALYWIELHAFLDGIYFYQNPEKTTLSDLYSSQEDALKSHLALPLSLVGSNNESFIILLDHAFIYYRNAQSIKYLNSLLDKIDETIKKWDFPFGILLSTEKHTIALAKHNSALITFNIGNLDTTRSGALNLNLSQAVSQLIQFESDFSFFQLKIYVPTHNKGNIIYTELSKILKSLSFHTKEKKVSPPPTLPLSCHLNPFLTLSYYKRVCKEEHIDFENIIFDSFKDSHAETIKLFLDHERNNKKINDWLYFLVEFGLNDELDLTIKLIEIRRLKECLKINPTEKTSLLCVSIYSFNSYALTKILSYNAIDINQLDDNGDTLLHLSMIKRNHEAAEILLSQKEINLFVENKNGLTLLEVAIEDNREDFFRLFMRQQKIVFRLQSNKAYRDKVLGLSKKSRSSIFFEALCDLLVKNPTKCSQTD